ncbi:MAG: low molecular weight protein arginine phosphatase, partial [Lysinibacillus sp.]
LSEYVMDSKKDVSDPFGGDLHTYEATFEELQRLIDALQSKIVEE